MVSEDGERLHALLAQADARAEEMTHDAIRAIQRVMNDAQAERQCRIVTVYMSTETQRAITRQAGFLSSVGLTPPRAPTSPTIAVGEPQVVAIMDAQAGRPVWITPEEALGFGLAQVKVQRADGRRALIPCFLQLERWR